MVLSSSKGNSSSSNISVAAVEAAVRGALQVSREEESKISKYYHWNFVQSACALIIFCMIVVGNSSILHRLKSCRRRRSNVNYFIMQLAVADLFVGCFSVTLDTLLRLKGSFPYGLIACRATKYISNVFIYSSTFLLVALSIDRWEAVVRPLAFTKNRNHGFYLVVCAWSLALICSMPVTVRTTIKSIDGLDQCYVDYSKKEWKIYVVYLTCSLLVVPAIIIAICYTLIVRTIWRRGRSVIQDSPTRLTHQISSSTRIDDIAENKAAANSVAVVAAAASPSDDSEADDLRQGQGCNLSTDHSELDSSQCTEDEELESQIGASGILDQYHDDTQRQQSLKQTTDKPNDEPGNEQTTRAKYITTTTTTIGGQEAAQQVIRRPIGEGQPERHKYSERPRIRATNQRSLNGSSYSGHQHHHNHQETRVGGGQPIGRRKENKFVGAQQHGNGIIPKARIKTIKMTLVIVVAFVCCWLPFCIINLCVTFRVMRIDTQFGMGLVTLTQTLAHLQSAVNPIIFWIFSSKRSSSSSASNSKGNNNNNNHNNNNKSTLATASSSRLDRRSSSLKQDMRPNHVGKRNNAKRMFCWSRLYGFLSDWWSCDCCSCPCQRLAMGTREEEDQSDSSGQVYPITDQLRQTTFGVVLLPITAAAAAADCGRDGRGTPPGDAEEAMHDNQQGEQISRILIH